MDWAALESRPGSFSKNFGWNARPGLKLLHEVINSIFEDGIQPVERESARAIIAERFNGDPLIPLNFFLYNNIVNGVSYIVADQLVLNALAEGYSRSFDYLAISAFNFSRVGRWIGARNFQSHPAPWARGFVIDVLYVNGKWDPRHINSDTIENFLNERLNHRVKDTRKFATNLNFIYQHSGMLTLQSSETQDWWAASLFLFLDRSIMDGEITSEEDTQVLLDFLDREQFWALTAVDQFRARYAARGVIDEYKDLGGLSRLSRIPEDPVVVQGDDQDDPIAKRARRRRLAQYRQPNDLGLTPVQRVFVQAQRQVRNRSHVQFLKALYEDRCAVCGGQLQVNASNLTYSEAGHIRPIGDPFGGPDHLSNILLFCPNHHKVFDRGGVWIDAESSTIRSATGDRSFDLRELEIHERHAFDLQYAEWHARYFGHMAVVD